MQVKVYTEFFQKVLIEVTLFNGLFYYYLPGRSTGSMCGYDSQHEAVSHARQMISDMPYPE